MTLPDEEESMFGSLESLLTGIVGLAMVTTLVLPGRQTAKILAAQNAGFAGMVRAAKGGAVNQTPTLSPATQFAMRATEAIADFWSGFGE